MDRCTHFDHLLSSQLAQVQHAAAWRCMGSGAPHGRTNSTGALSAASLRAGTRAQHGALPCQVLRWAPQPARCRGGFVPGYSKQQAGSTSVCQHQLWSRQELLRRRCCHTPCFSDGQCSGVPPCPTTAVCCTLTLCAAGQGQVSGEQPTQSRKQGWSGCSTRD
jgi:hypothetical protein